MSPHTLLTGLTMNYNRHCRLEFREYVQTHEEHDNSHNLRTIGTLALRPTGNVQGGYFFLSLTMGKVINRMCWTTIPMPKEVIDHVERMTRQEHMGTTLLFEDRDHNEIIDLDHEDDDDSAYEPDDQDDNDDDDNEDDNDNDDNNVLINQPNEGHSDPGILGGQDAQQDDNEEDNNEDEVERNHNNNDGDENADANTHDDDGSVELADMNDNTSESVHSEETMDHNPGGTTGVEPLPLIQVQND